MASPNTRSRGLTFSTKRTADKQSSDRPVLPEGIYRMVVVKAEERVGKESGVPYANLQLRQLKNGKASGPIVFDRISTSEAARFKIEQFLDAVDAPEDGEIGLGWFMGKAVYVNVSVETFNKQLQNKVVRYLTEDEALKQLEALGDDDDYDGVSVGYVDDDDDDEDEDDEDEEEETPVARASAKRKATPKKATKKSVVVDEDEDDFPV